MKRLLFLIVISLFTLSNSATAQEIDYLKKANEAFIKGNYTYAITMYKMYYVETGKDISELQRQAVLCRDYLHNADSAALTKDYTTAALNYEKILELNPEDASVKSKLSNLKGVISSSGLKIGQEYLGGRIAYIDNTGKHGLIITSISKEPMTYSKGIRKAPKGSRVPTLRELKMIAPCAEMLKLYDKYWSVDVHNVSTIRSSTNFAYYITFLERDSDSYKKENELNYITNYATKTHYFSFIYIKDF